MLFPIRKNREPVLELSQLTALARLVRDYPPTAVHFMDSLPYVLRLLGVSSGSAYLFDDKNSVFLLKSWSGKKPLRFSLSTEQEFIKFIKLRDGTVAREEFIRKAHELRQSALFFFQQTSSTRVLPVRSGENWMALICLDEEGDSLKPEIMDEILAVYAVQLCTWVAHDRISQDYKKNSELGQVKNELLHNITHEFQTPLNGILGITDAILEGADGSLNDALKGHLEMIRKSGAELSDTLGNIIKLTQIEANRGHRHLERVNVLNLAEEAVLLYQSVFEERHNRCVLPQKSSEYEIFAEADQIRTVFMNLIGNAVKFTKNGEVAISMHRNGEMLHVSVMDTGMGIDAEKLELIFEEFYQADGSHTRAHGGAGLGLALVKKIVVFHGGRIWAESERGTGTKIHFTLRVFPG